MKKTLLFTCLLLLCAGLSFAQTTPSKTGDKKTKSKTETTKTSATAGPTKKDGTADMRYKANKGTKTPTQHLKKDGTPDKRFKENKEQKTASPAKKS